MKNVVITGSTRGLGYELAAQFLKRGCSVVICGTREETVYRAAASLEQIGSGKVYGTKCDVSDPDDINELADYALSRLGSIDIWINNAGVNQSSVYCWDVPQKEIGSLIDVDLKGTIYGTQAAIRLMSKQGSGAIYNVEGMGSNDAFQSFLAIYGTAKRAVTYFTDAAAKEAAEKGLPVIIGKLSPGIMITDFLTSVGSERGKTELNDKTKKVYNILGDKPDVIAEYLVSRMWDNKKNGVRISWLTGAKAAYRFATAGFNKRDFFS